MWSIESIKAQNVISFESLEFVVQNGQALPIVGQNLDDLGQEANGAGKSALFEIVSMGITGDSMRKVSVKENIQDGFDEAYVEILLNNSTINSSLLITRTFRTKKSTVISVELNGKTPNIKTSDSGDLDGREANLFILDTLGVTREDLFNYYLISQQNFVSFLQASDTKKKEIISRFSNTQTIDKVIDYIGSEHIDPLGEKLTIIEQQQVAINAKISVRKEQLEELNEGEFERLKKEKIDQLKGNIEASKISIKNQGEKIDRIVEHSKAIDEEILNIEKELEAEKVTLGKIEDAGKKAKKKNDQLQSSFQTERETLLKSRTGKIKEALDEAKEDNQLQDGEISKVKAELRSIENRLMGSITCPECEHEFKLGEEVSMKDLLIQKQKLKTSIEEAEVISGKIVNAIEAKQKELNEATLVVTKELDQSRDAIDKQKDKIDEIRNDFRNQEVEVFEIKHKLRAENAKIVTNNGSIKSFEGYIEQEKESIESYMRAIELEEEKTLGTKKEEIENKIEELDDEYLDKVNELASLSEEKDEYDNWILSFMKFKTRLANNSIKTIETFANFYLGKMKSNIRIRIDGYKTLASGQVREKISTTVFRDGIEKGSYGKFSAGERARIDIAVTAALQSIINSASTSGGLNMLFMDEILDAVDTLGLKSITHALQNLGITIMIVTQNTIDQLGEGCLLVQKENGKSKILIR